MKRFLCLIVFAFVFVCTDAPAQVTAIKAGKLVVPESGTTLTNQIILVEGGRTRSA